MLQALSVLTAQQATLDPKVQQVTLDLRVQEDSGAHVVSPVLAVQSVLLALEV